MACFYYCACSSNIPVGYVFCAEGKHYQTPKAIYTTVKHNTEQAENLLDN